MKWLFAFLVVLNLIVAGWVIARPPSNVEQHVAVAKVMTPGVARLVLTNEAEQQALMVPTSRCLSLGPTQAQAIAQTLVDRAHSQGASATLRKEELQQWLVWLPAAASRRATRDHLRALQARGITDVSIIGRGPHKNAISLGVYDLQQAAQERVRELATLGETATLEANPTGEIRYWVDITAGAERLDAAWIATQRTDFSGVDQQELPCP